MKNSIFLMIVAIFVLSACSEEERAFVKTDTVAPGPVSEVQVRNIPGGAILTYRLPEDEDLMYVKATYSLKNGSSDEVRTSLYVDTLKIQGFGTEDTYNVKLYAVDRSENISLPVEISINPLEAPVMTIGKTLTLMADFGGVHAYWDNPNQAEISVVLESQDNNNEFIPIDTYYSSMVVGDASTRGMDTIPKNFRIYVRDRWENTSPVQEYTLAPLFEEQFDRYKFKGLSVEGDEPSAWGWVLSNLYDGNRGTGFHTANGSGRWPQSITLDMGSTGRISRIKTWPRADGEWEFRHGNMKRFEVYGTTDGEHLNDWNSWTKMMTCVSVKPSGLPMGQLSAEDKALAIAGEEFIFPPTAPKVRYLRINVLETWSGGDFFHFMEIAVYGQVDK